MAELKAELHVKTDVGYDTINLKTVSEITVFDPTGSVLISTDVDSAIKEVQTNINNLVINSISSAPSFIGQFSVVGSIGYMAVGTSTTADWKQITN